jgi:hypothetical protein
MAYPDSPTKHAAAVGRAGKVDSSAVPRDHSSSRDRPKLAWGSAAVAENGATTVEVDEAIDSETWKLSIDMPVCYVSVQIEGSKELGQLLDFLRRADADHPLGAFGEFRIPRSSAILVWDDETSGRLFIWLNRSGKHSIRAELGRQQVDCIRSALADATRPG